jgi:septal ring factor EnvC (AmiA/AmiB activator)
VKEKKVTEKKARDARLQGRLAEVRKELSREAEVQARPDRVLARPVDDYVSFTASPKGVTFRFQAVQPVKAAASGKIVYAGDLASYGQVVLVDHGNDLRTVLLGRMSLKVKKDDPVKEGDVLAYTEKDSTEAQNLYFEVRKKNTAQNTILWLDQGVVSKI